MSGDSLGPAAPGLTPTTGGVRLLIVMPNDPERMRIGGINAFVRGLVKFAPPDFDLAFIGVTADRRLWEWRWIRFEGRDLRFMPIARGQPGVRSRIPVALRFAGSMLLHRRALRLDGWIASFHRPGTEIAMRDFRMPMWRVVHLAVEDLSTHGSESRWRRLAGPLAAVERRAFRRMDRIYVVNEQVAGAYRHRFPEVADRIRFLPNWADPTLFHPVDAATREALRGSVAAEIGQPVDGPLVLYAGRLEGQKDPLLLAEAFASFADGHSTARLLIAGEGTLEPQVRARLQASGLAERAHFLGTLPRPRVAELMAAADAMLITSAFETGPTVGLEALACGLPVVTTAVGQVSRVVADTGAGVTVAARTPSALADALGRVISQPVEALRAAAAQAAGPYLADRVLEELYAYNRDLAARGSAGGAGA
ncbi:MAG TPA: glycosyltransferase [Candidatus Limnocylindria bacterium]